MPWQPISALHPFLKVTPFMHRFYTGVLCSLLMLLGSPSLQAKDKAPPYLALEQLDSTRFLAPPPGAVQTQQEIEAMLVLQSQRTPEQAALAAADLEQSVFAFANVMGPAFKEDDLPRTAKFFKRLYQTQKAFAKQGKKRWQRLRPPQTDPRIDPVAGYGETGSYPSGHATFAFLAAIALADMVPELRTPIFDRAKAFGDHRVLGGAHFPSDVEAGRQLAVMIAVLAVSNPNYRQDFALAKAELRTALSLP